MLLYEEMLEAKSGRPGSCQPPLRKGSVSQQRETPLSLPNETFMAANHDKGYTRAGTNKSLGLTRMHFDQMNLNASHVVLSLTIM